MLEAACRVLGIYGRGEGSGWDKEGLLGVLINRFDDCDERVQLAALQACSCIAGLLTYADVCHIRMLTYADVCAFSLRPCRRASASQV